MSAAIVVAYALSPIDLIPDIIPNDYLSQLTWAIASAFYRQPQSLSPTDRSAT